MALLLGQEVSKQSLVLTATDISPMVGVCITCNGANPHSWLS